MAEKSKQRKLFGYQLLCFLILFIALNVKWKGKTGTQLKITKEQSVSPNPLVDGRMCVSCLHGNVHGNFLSNHNKQQRPYNAYCRANTTDTATVTAIAPYILRNRVHLLRRSNFSFYITICRRICYVFSISLLMRCVLSNFNVNNIYWIQSCTPLLFVTLRLIH